MKKDIIEMLLKLPFVMWDRYTDDFGQYTFYGWIKRKDEHEDFVVINFPKDDIEKPWYTTSSKIYSKKIGLLLGHKAKDHNDCKRVEKFCTITNCIKLKK